MALDPDHALAVLACSADALPRQTVAEAAQRAGLDWMELETGEIDLDVPIPLVLKVEGWFRFSLAGKDTLLVELWGEAYGRDYGCRVRLLGEPGLEVFASPPAPGVALEGRWQRGVAALAQRLGREIEPARLAAVLAAAWPGPLAEIWEALVARY
jgi:hypothetical protein